MKVRKLLEALENFDPNARVILATQSHRPLESYAIGVVERSSYTNEPEHGKADDVLILEGDQIGYGDKEAWDYA